MVFIDSYTSLLNLSHILHDLYYNYMQLNILYPS